jgi:hypothetical protein
LHENEPKGVCRLPFKFHDPLLPHFLAASLRHSVPASSSHCLPNPLLVPTPGLSGHNGIMNYCSNASLSNTVLAARPSGPLTYFIASLARLFHYSLLNGSLLYFKLVCSRNESVFYETKCKREMKFLRNNIGFFCNNKKRISFYSFRETSNNFKNRSTFSECLLFCTSK